MSAPNVPPALPHTVNVSSNSTGSSKTQAAAGHRAKVGHLNLPAKQSISLNGDLKNNEIMYFPSSGTPAFGSYFTIDIRSQNIKIHNLILQFNLGAIVGSGLSGVLNPAWWLFERIELVQNNTTRIARKKDF